MNNKIIIFVIILAALAAGIGIGFFIGKNVKNRTGIEQNQQTQNLKPGDNNPTGAKPSNLITKDGFSIKIPDGWKEAPAMSGVAAMIVNQNENPENPALKRINFKSYFSVTYDKLGTKTKEEYINYIKDEVVKNAPGFKFTSEKNEIINGQDGYALEGQVSQQGADFKIAMTFIKGKSDDMWMVSFSTGKDMWPQYAQLVDETIRSFTVN